MPSDRSMVVPALLVLFAVTLTLLALRGDPAPTQPVFEPIDDHRGEADADLESVPM